MKLKNTLSTGVLGSLLAFAVTAVVPSIMQTASADTGRCAPVGVTQPRMTNAHFDGKHYTFRVHGYADTLTSRAYYGGYQNRKPANGKIAIGYHRGWDDVGEFTLTRYMTSGRGYNVSMPKPVKTPFLKSRYSIVTLTATTKNPECGPAALLVASQKWDLRPVKHGQAPRKIGRPHYYNQGFRIKLKSTYSSRNPLAGSRS